MTYGVASMTAPLREVALRRPGKSIITAEASAWNYGKHFDPSKIESEYDRFVSALENFGVKIHWMKGDDLGNADSVFAYDASLMAPNGAILMLPGKKKGEEKKICTPLSIEVTEYQLSDRLKLPERQRQAIHFGLMKILCL